MFTPISHGINTSTTATKAHTEQQDGLVSSALVVELKQVSTSALLPTAAAPALQSLNLADRTSISMRFARLSVTQPAASQDAD
ncbi:MULTISPECIES: hypothetical protein [unclassified Undibacterium]|uniref:hypothetical protein n=1 Tax=unclassified Undibacterium TaxID=2630295 RepID=UPI002AC8B624|nr:MULTISPECIES: hypothetical protein [unclassified Undibacterium]MEB0138869.1 hypothetical protein [Undibacterium sp. CCC2.1]MEB0172269.1 hypothetical protein [Undibacterium sp. CCC1.1]MEB0176114.1 hypothetical protein [Undibacterium sp. CCC3.4]MEB0215925.1 hypothetical protein [Undibacterium sp. 5I2]WPX44745.1 hypothetical protein RHM61_05825 [Undibacterium sp. CCC3.4]